ncbi:hypothetical protein MLD38_013848 [Melastoma candidum]|uniref:Uncharacterized protein n=1 Tax=Melastoma candidum TaxID=119954 RepID=A0ACB9RAV7_9MYRT|nr:hypothetical protein MLD38_013848 [Melastoma candidum]
MSGSMSKRLVEIPLCCMLVSVVVFAQLTLQQQQPVVALSSGVERVALLQLRSSLGIRSKDWPRKADPCSAWVGITCTNRRVIGINVSGFRRTRLGSLNPQFSMDALRNFTLLASLNASNFVLPGQIPDWFGQQLVSLQVLDLRSCSISGSIPSSLGNLTNLTGLFLSDNNLTGVIPSSLGKLLRILNLDFSRNSLSGSIPSSFTSLKNLTFLGLSSNALSGSIPMGFGSLTGLQQLNLSGNHLSGLIPPQLGDLGRLVDLDLSSNNISGSVPLDLQKLRSLQKIWMSDNLLGGSLPDDLFSSGQSQLQVVVFRNNLLTGTIPSALWSLPELILLDISGNNLTGLLPSSSLNATVTTAILNISGNSLFGNLTSSLKRFSYYDLSGNYFEGKVPAYVLVNASLGNNCLQNVSNQRTAGECASFYASKGLVFDNFGRPVTPPPVPPLSPKSKKSKKWLYILIGVLGGVALILLLAAICCLLFICGRRKGSLNQRAAGVEPASTGGATTSPSGAPTSLVRVGDSYTYQQLLQATNQFSESNLIKHGHSGDLFRGMIEGGVPVVVKKIDLAVVKRELYTVELDFFGKVSHGRFVPFLGHYLENEHEKYLVYKYMPNEDLLTAMLKKTATEDDSLLSLDWIKRLKIAVGTAEALSFLHHECSPPLVHRDVQASSILLDDKYEVRLGSLSDVSAQEGDTHQSRITRLLRLPSSSESGSSANCAYDVYCFGKVLLELVTGKLGLSASNDAETKEFIDQTLPYINIYDKELVTKIVDPLLIVDEDFLEEVWAMAIIARSCLNPKQSRRPPMRYILKALENPLKIVREENTGSGRLRTTSSRGSWNATLFGSWRSSSDLAVVPGSSAAKAEGTSKQSGTTGSQGSGHNGNSSSSRRRHSKEICPEPSDVQDVERQEQD